jgi:2-amino-4-hydroxy-6-hydroxymethyldihydropteridine diphosphokinase
VPHRAFIGVGSNLGDRRANVSEAIDRVAELPNTRMVRKSSLYESEPHGDAKTWFVNAAFEVETEYVSSDLLKRLKAIEEAMGRKRVKGKKWGSRIIDLDILFFDNEIVSTRTLKIPHPRIAARKFVLLPLAEVAPSLSHPELGQTISQILATSKDSKRVTLMPPNA